MVSPARDQANSLQIADGLKVEANVDDDSGTRPRKRHRHSKDDVYTGSKESTDMVSIDAQHNSSIDHKSGIEMCSLMGGESSALLSGAEAKQSPTQHLKVGSEVEVLSQDSGPSIYAFNTEILKTKRKENLSVIKIARQGNTNLIYFVKPSYHNHLVLFRILVHVFQVGNKPFILLRQDIYKVMNLEGF